MSIRSAVIIGITPLIVFGCATHPSDRPTLAYGASRKSSNSKGHVTLVESAIVATRARVRFDLPTR